jgi:hypothetical protein
MYSPCLDKTILNLLTILISGSGIFAVLIKFSVPELNITFMGGNPYIIKRDIIEKVMTRIFIALALIGLLIQTYAVIYGNKLNERLYSISFYIVFFLACIAGMTILVICLGAIGKYIAKKIWWPQLIKKQHKGFHLAEEIIKNGGYYNKDLDKKISFTDEQKQQITESRYKQCYEILSRIEDLLEIHDIPKTIEERYNNLKKFFGNIDS